MLTLDVETPLGKIRLAATGEALVGLWFHGQRWEVLPQASWITAPDHRLLRETIRQIDAYFAGFLKEFDLPLDPHGSVFHKSVWEAIRKIPFGLTRNCAQLARELGCPREARTVGAAAGRNPISIIIPCHRVLGTTGSLAGCAGGLARQEALLAMETGRRFRSVD